MNSNTIDIQARLLALADGEYRLFQCKLTPTVSPDDVIGVRIPILRKLAAEIKGTPEADAFLACLPHRYYDENNLHGLLISAIKDYPRAIEAIEAFFPYIDNWATCDIISPKIFGKHRAELYERIKVWISSTLTYEIRFGIEMLMTFFLDDSFNTKILDIVADIRSEEYYVNMMIAWFFATALAKKYNETLPYIENNRLAPDTHNKTIRKAIESFRIGESEKLYLRSLAIKRS